MEEVLLTPEKEARLLAFAKKALEKSYSPYSHFPVGAALLCQDGSIFEGSNIENASFPLSMCAERNALYHALMEGKKKEEFVALAVIADTEEPCSPCGACRQVISELYPSHRPIYLYNCKQGRKVVWPNELLPFAFKGEDL